MRRILVVILALSLGGCVNGTAPPWLIDAEQQAAALLTKIEAKAPLVEGEIDAGIAAVCGKLPEITKATDDLVAFIPNPGPKTQRFIQVADQSLASAMDSCAAWAKAPSVAGNIGFFKRLYAAFTTGKRAYADAKAAGGM